MRYGTRWTLAGAMIATSAVTLGAQETGVVTGRVTERGSGTPLVAAQVMIAGTTRGTVTAEDGRFRLTGVPAGTAQLRVLRIGYRAVTQPITVTAGQTLTADVVLEASAVSLDAQVVSATGGTERKRENDLTIPSLYPEVEELGYLGGHTLGELLQVEKEATVAAMTLRGRMNMPIAKM